MMKFWIGVDVVLCMVFCICGYLLIQSVRQSTTQKNIRKFIELTADYKQAVDSFKNNFEKSGEIIPHIQTSVDDMAKVLVSIRDFGIKIPGMNRRIEPFIPVFPPRPRSALKSRKPLLKSSAPLKRKTSSERERAS